MIRVRSHVRFPRMYGTDKISAVIWHFRVNSRLPTDEIFCPSLYNSSSEWSARYSQLVPSSPHEYLRPSNLCHSLTHSQEDHSCLDPSPFDLEFGGSYEVGYSPILALQQLTIPAYMLGRVNDGTPKALLHIIPRSSAQLRSTCEVFVRASRNYHSQRVDLSW